LSTTPRDARKEKDDQRDQKILNLFLVCHTEQEIVDKLGVPQQTVNRIIQSFTQNGELAKMGNAPPASLQVSNLWSFDSCDPAFGSEKCPGTNSFKAKRTY
jgi:hypothetical protein